MSGWKNNLIVFIFIEENYKYKQSDCCTGNIDIRYIKNWKINQCEIKKIYHIVTKNSIDQIADRTGGETDDGQIQRKKVSVPGNPPINNRKKNKNNQSQNYKENHFTGQKYVRISIELRDMEQSV